jgi:hypothetical protein
MRYEVKPTSVLAKRLKVIGTWLQNHSSSKTGTVNRLIIDNRLRTHHDLKVKVTPKGTVSFHYSGLLNDVYTVIEFKYGKLTAEQYTNYRLQYVTDKRAVTLTRAMLKQVFSHVPDKVTRDNAIHL